MVSYIFGFACGVQMNYFLATFAVMLIFIGLLAIGVMFGRRAIKGSCGGLNSSNCVCVEKCEKRKKMEAEGQA
jgi:hypothetical protein